MTDLDRAIAAAREALAAADESLQGNAAPSAMLSEHYDACAGCADTLRELIAALDAARGRAVAWCCPQTICDADGYPEESETPYMEWGQARPDWQGQWTPLFAAPPAAVAVPASKGDAERSKAWRSVCDTLDRVCPDWMDANGKTGTELAVAAIERLAARQPAAAVPEGYAAAIKAVQEMMPPRDFRPSAQVWLTGNQVNELHARLDAAAMLAAERKRVGNG